MGGFALSSLAISVSLAGGLGLIGSSADMTNLRAELTKVSRALPLHKSLLPIGVGFLIFATEIQDAMDVLREFKPAVVWLFAAARGVEDYVEWAENVRSVSRESQVWVQIGSVEGAVRVAERVRPDVLCIQVSLYLGSKRWSSEKGVAGCCQTFLPA
jgi:nitronate monooxygenase